MLILPQYTFDAESLYRIYWIEEEPDATTQTGQSTNNSDQ